MSGIHSVSGMASGMVQSQIPGMTMSSGMGSRMSSGMGMSGMRSGMGSGEVKPDEEIDTLLCVLRKLGRTFPVAGEYPKLHRLGLIFLLMIFNFE